MTNKEIADMTGTLLIKYMEKVGYRANLKKDKYYIDLLETHHKASNLVDMEENFSLFKQLM